MIETLQAIAMLCMVSSGGDTGGLSWVYKNVDKYQLECQQYYVKCEQKKTLATCVLERKAG